MSNWNNPDMISDIRRMHDFYGFTEIFKSFSPEQINDYIRFRIEFLEEELEELKESIRKKDSDLFVDSIIDLIVVAMGTLDALDVDTSDAWQRVYLANMAKTPGKKEGRDNPNGLPDLIKPTMETHGFDWVAPQHTDNTGRLAEIWGSDYN